MTREFSGYLTDDQLRVVHDAAVAAGLANSAAHVDVLVTGLPPDVASALPGSGEKPAARLTAQLRQLNTIHNLGDGTVPLLAWLHQAATLAGDGRPADVFEAAIDHVSQTTAAVPAPIAEQIEIGDFAKIDLVHNELVTAAFVGHMHAEQGLLLVRQIDPVHFSHPTGSVHSSGTASGSEGS